MISGFSALVTLAQSDFDDDYAGGGTCGALLFMLIFLYLLVVNIGGMWKVFEKAGKSGWACLLPIYNIVLLLQIVGRPIWWVVLMFIPFVGIFVYVVVSIDIAKSFGKDVLYGLGLFFFPFIFFPLLGYGSDTYKGPSVTAG